MSLLFTGLYSCRLLFRQIKFNTAMQFIVIKYFTCHMALGSSPSSFLSLVVLRKSGLANMASVTSSCNSKKILL